ncbi:MAG: branched chain amino acid aminotransferase [Deltaproteobacteria bacterium HGW-Deltaproteobacteria-19]|jgi:branched-chain amino acid aminotransferase|nr:MAG: branched chain amino acid aminotransferase [Deltaproteobacteria bacterium HGW-Deltaproteobacteria-19]
MKIKITKTAPAKCKPKYKNEAMLGFGKIFTDHMFTMPYKEGKGWFNPAIEPYRDFHLDPACICLHYAQLIFEGLKAYRGKDGAIYLFRPLENARRMNNSARRLCMPAVDENLFLEAVRELVIIEKDWIPKGLGTSLYIRPTMIATEPALGVHASPEYLFYIIVGPVGAYYPEGFSPTKIFVEEHYVRSAPGGIGYCKAAANYAASLYASKAAQEKGYTQVLWLDAVHKKYVEEVGTSNIFFIIGDELVTPPLGGTILPGITRDSVIQLARSWGIPVMERPVTMEEVIIASERGLLKEAFASGTAAIVSPIGQMFFRGKEHKIGSGKTGTLTKRLYNEILQIQYGEKEDPFGWRLKISG